MAKCQSNSLTKTKIAERFQLPCSEARELNKIKGLCLLLVHASQDGRAPARGWPGDMWTDAVRAFCQFRNEIVSHKSTKKARIQFNTRSLVSIPAIGSTWLRSARCLFPFLFYPARPRLRFIFHFLIRVGPARSGVINSWWWSRLLYIRHKIYICGVPIISYVQIFLCISISY